MTPLITSNCVEDRRSRPILRFQLTGVVAATRAVVGGDDPSTDTSPPRDAGEENS